VPSAQKFSKQQFSSLIELMEQMSKLDGKKNKEQNILICKTSDYFKQLNKDHGKWN